MFGFDLHPGWAALPDREGAYRRRGQGNRNLLTISTIAAPNGARLPMAANLEGFLRDLVVDQGGAPGESATEPSAVGRTCWFGFAPQASSGLVYGEYWAATNETQLAVVSYVCDAQPSRDELDQVAAMVASIRF